MSSLTEDSGRPFGDPHAGISVISWILSEPGKRVAIALIAITSTGFALYTAAGILVPVTVAGLLFFMMSPIAERLVRHHVPRGIAAAICVSLLLAPLAIGVMTLSDPAAEWLRQAPTSIGDLRGRVGELMQPLEQFRSASEAVDQVVEDLADLSGSKSDEPTVIIREQGLLESAIQYIPALIGSLVVSFALAFLLLLKGRHPLCRCLTWGTSFGTRRRAVRAIAGVEAEISRYLLTILMINLSLGVISAACFWLIGLPNPILWGAIAGLLNFAPYAGAAVTVLVLTVVGVTTFSTLPQALAPAGLFLVLTVLEGQVVTPVLLGRRFAINPALALLAVICLAWIWGLAGALLAMPALVTVRILAHSLRYRSVAMAPPIRANFQGHMIANDAGTFRA